MTTRQDLPLDVKRHLEALGVYGAGQDLIAREMDKAFAMSRDQLKNAIELKNAAIRYLRVQQAVYLTALERGLGDLQKDHRA